MWPFRCQKLSFCVICAVAFKPRDDRWAGLCIPHMLKQRDEDDKRDRVMEWAWRTWEQQQPIANAYWDDLDSRNSANGWRRLYDTWRGR